ncbi:LD-carboxypeptidase [Sedimentibacter sp. zth1]|uniref:S66 family peptidase n=1 Tax=Sedimentibacter sp. zth1 TaxID=2816908 RepID=UPI001A910E67|nr:S66 peptidase family protein [Sedimentibacter sp. zth1]QSX06458.1 LD-carboxypeptidase [Sedimentibacter sp. zth1]
MLNLIKPQKLNRGDKVATVSLSWGGAGDKDILWRYYQGKKRLEEQFGLQVVEMPHTLKGSEFVYNHPKERADDLMQAFSDKSIKGIISCIGGTDSIRMFPYIDFKIIKNNPKIFTGYSDSTVTHFMCMKAGISSFYGPAILTDFAENIKIPKYTVNAINNTFFSNENIGEVVPSKTWTSQRLEWVEENKDTARIFSENTSYEVLQGNGKAQGRLIGGCLEVIEYIKGTSLFPPVDYFNNAILFLETCEVLPPVWLIEDELRCFGMMGMLNRISGIFWGKSQGEKYYEEYKVAIRKVLAEFDCSDLPVLYNGSFGHNEPRTILPYGAIAEIDCENNTFSILDNATL